MCWWSICSTWPSQRCLLSPRVLAMLCCLVLTLTSWFVILPFQETLNMLLCHLWWAPSSCLFGIQTTRNSMRQYSDEQLEWAIQLIPARCLNASITYKLDNVRNRQSGQHTVCWLSLKTWLGYGRDDGTLWLKDGIRLKVGKVTVKWSTSQQWPLTAWWHGDVMFISFSTVLSIQKNKQVNTLKAIQSCRDWTGKC